MRVLLTGASGQLGAYLLAHLRGSSHEIVAWSGKRQGELLGSTLVPVDLADEAQVREAFEAARPDLVIHAAAMSAIGECYSRPDRAHAVNAQATCLLAALSQWRGLRMVYISTDLVFDGETSPCHETTAPRPLSIYGRTKLAPEPAVLNAGGVVLRVSLMYGPSLIGRSTFFDHQIEAMRTGQTFRLFDDEWRTPLDLQSAAKCIWNSAVSDNPGLFHLGGRERLSRLELGQQIAAAVGLDPSLLQATSRLSVGGPEPRPRDTSLNKSRWWAHFGPFEFLTVDEAVPRLLYKQ